MKILRMENSHSGITLRNALIRFHIFLPQEVTSLRNPCLVPSEVICFLSLEEDVHTINMSIWKEKILQSLKCLVIFLHSEAVTAKFTLVNVEMLCSSEVCECR